jgi:3-phosphoshikimate 1-carboxyvinyltransferase
MKTVLCPQQLHGKIEAIPSKSCGHRALICAGLSDKETQIICPDTSEDIECTATCLRGLGASVVRENRSYRVKPIDSGCDGSGELFCGESGSTLRFLLPVACALGGNYLFHMKGRLPKRPLSPLYEELVAHGAKLGVQGTNPLSVQGHISSGIFHINGTVSSQFVSGLLFALPLLTGNSTILIEGRLESKPYVDITLDALQRFGISVDVQKNSFNIPGGQTYKSPGALEIEGDWSAAAAWICAGALSEVGIRCSGLSLDSLQGDKAIIEIVQAFGAKVRCETNGDLLIQKGQLHGIDLDVTDTPDLVPVIAALASGANGCTRIYGAARLRLKESDRLNTTASVLNELGGQVEVCSDGLIITGRDKLKGGAVSALGDHRIAMCAAVASCLCAKPVTIENSEAIGKSYPGFWTDFAKLGGAVQV